MRGQAAQAAAALYGVRTAGQRNHRAALPDMQAKDSAAGLTRERGVMFQWLENCRDKGAVKPDVQQYNAAYEAVQDILSRYPAMEDVGR